MRVQNRKRLNEEEKLKRKQHIWENKNKRLQLVNVGKTLMKMHAENTREYNSLYEEAFRKWANDPNRRHDDTFLEQEQPLLKRYFSRPKFSERCRRSLNSSSY